MSWSAAYRARIHPPADILDSVDTVAVGECELAQSVQTVQSVTAPAVASEGASAEAQADRAAVEADTWGPAASPQHPPPLDVLVDRLARAMETPRRWQRAKGVGAMAYFRFEAQRRLQQLNPLARGLPVTTAEAEARRHEGQARLLLPAAAVRIVDAREGEAD